MKQYVPLASAVMLLVVVIGALWYEVGLGKPASSEATIVSGGTNINLTAKSLKDASDAAAKFASGLVAHGKVPLDTTGLPTNPSPLFTPVKQ